MAHAGLFSDKGSLHRIFLMRKFEPATTRFMLEPFIQFYQWRTVSAPAAALLLYVGTFYTVLPVAHSISAGSNK
jgi:hypothetical protein